MDIGTGKDLGEYIVDGVPVPYHLIDVAEPGHLFSVFEFQQRFYECFREITAARQDAGRRGRDGPLHRVDPAGVPDAARTGKRGPERGVGSAGHGGTGREAPSPEPRPAQHDGSHRERAPDPRHRDRRTHVNARVEGGDRAAGHRPAGDRGPMGSHGASGDGSRSV